MQMGREAGGYINIFQVTVNRVAACTREPVQVAGFAERAK